MAAKPKAKTIDEYLAAVGDDQRAALEKLRRTIKAAIPKAEECINYGVAAFCLDGVVLIGFGAGANHCSLFPMSGSTTTELRGDLRDYETSKGAIRFQPGSPLPAALVRKVIKARKAEIARREKKSKS